MGQNLQFVFDPFSDRAFYMTVKETILGKQNEEPEVVRSVGKAPKQIEDLDFSLPTMTKGDFDGESFEEDSLFSDDASYNSDELDMEGFEISDSSEPY